MTRNLTPEQVRIASLEAALLDLLERVQRLEQEAADRRLAQAIKMKDAA